MEEKILAQLEALNKKQEEANKKQRVIGALLIVVLYAVLVSIVVGFLRPDMTALGAAVGLVLGAVIVSFNNILHKGD